MIVLGFYGEGLVVAIGQSIEMEAVVVDCVRSNFFWGDVPCPFMKTAEIVLIILKCFWRLVFRDFDVFEETADVLGKFHGAELIGLFYSSSFDNSSLKLSMSLK